MAFKLRVAQVPSETEEHDKTAKLSHSDRSKVRSMYRKIARGNYEFSAARAFTDHEQMLLDLAVSKYVHDGFGHLGLSSFWEATKDAFMEGGPSNYAGNALGARFDLNANLRGYEGVGRVDGASRIMGKFLRNGDLETAMDIREGILYPSYYISYGKPLEPRVMAEVLDVVKEKLLEGEIDYVIRICRAFKLDNDKLGAIFSQSIDSLPLRRKDLYDPVKIAQTIGLPEEVIERIATRYYDTLASNGDKAGAAIVGVEAGKERVETDSLALDQFENLIRTGSYQEAADWARERGLGDELAQKALVIAEGLVELTSTAREVKRE